MNVNFRVSFLFLHSIFLNHVFFLKYIFWYFLFFVYMRMWMWEEWINNDKHKILYMFLLIFCIQIKLNMKRRVKQNWQQSTQQHIFCFLLFLSLSHLHHFFLVPKKKILLCAIPFYFWALLNGVKIFQFFLSTYS